MAATQTGDDLDKLLKTTQGLNRDQLAQQDFSLLLDGFLPKHTPSHRSKAYLVLSVVCQGIRSSVGDNEQQLATDTLDNVFRPLITTCLAETAESSLLCGITFFTALFQVDWQSASAVFLSDGVFENVMESVELLPSTTLCECVAHLLGQACGYKPCRAVMTAQSIEWLQSASRPPSNGSVRAAAAVALVKLSRGALTDNQESRGATSDVETVQDDDFVDMMKGMILSEGEDSSIFDAVEALAYLSIEPSVKETLSKDSVLLRRMSSLLPDHKAILSDNSYPLNSPLVYGIVSIIYNICAFRPRLTEEQTQLENLKQMAKPKKDAEPTKKASSTLEDNAMVKIRVRRVVDAGVLSLLAKAIKCTESMSARMLVGKTLLSIIEDKNNRGKVLQNGGAKILLLIIKQILSLHSSPKLPSFDVAYLDPIQALAKLAITSSPLQIFGPNFGSMYDAIRPLSILLQHPSASQLQRFEAIMALTNISSHSAEAASRVAKADGLVSQAEMLLLEENVLVRRAAMELICNLVVGADSVFERYGGVEFSEAAKSKLHLLVALCDVDDIQTRLAASGALATLSSSPIVCMVMIALQTERQRVLPILAQLLDPTSQALEGDSVLESHPGLIHRGVICTRNFLVNISDADIRKRICKEAMDVGLTQGLVNAIKAGDQVILGPGIEALKILAASGSSS